MINWKIKIEKLKINTCMYSEYLFLILFSIHSWHFYFEVNFVILFHLLPRSLKTTTTESHLKINATFPLFVSVGMTTNWSRIYFNECLMWSFLKQKFFVKTIIWITFISYDYAINYSSEKFKKIKHLFSDIIEKCSHQCYWSYFF